MNTKRDAFIGTAFGIGAALAYGASSVFIRQGISNLAPPLVGAAVSLLSGTLVFLIIRVRDFSANLTQNRKAVGFFLLAGLASSLGIVSSFFALSLTPVVTVSPLQSTSPLFVMLWSYLFLRRLERITPRLILGSVLVIFGVILITIGRAA